MNDHQSGDAVARVRDLATLLPGVHEQTHEGAATFLVDGTPFAKLDETGALHVRSPARDGAWTTLALGAGSDWTLVEDAIARSWELSAPAGLLEAGGR